MNIIVPFLLGELEEVTSFEAKNDEQRGEIVKIAIRSLEVGIIVMTKLIKEGGLESATVEKLAALVGENKLEEASALINSID